MSHVSRTAIQAILGKTYSRVEITLVDNVYDLEKFVSKKPDLVFLGMKFIHDSIESYPKGSEKIWISDYLFENNIACTGSDSYAHKLEYSKPLAKQRVLDAGLTTSPFVVVPAHSTSTVSPLGLEFPLFVKPTDRGGGAGIDALSVVRDELELRDKIQSITTKIGSDSLVEEYLSGREFSVAILKDENFIDYEVMPIELVALFDSNGARMLSRAVKSADTEQCSEIIEAGLKEVVSNLAINVFHALGARDYGRIDIRLDHLGIPHFLEANLIPSLISDYGSFPKAYEMNFQLGYETMICHIVRLGLRRSTRIYYEERQSQRETSILKLRELSLEI